MNPYQSTALLRNRFSRAFTNRLLFLLVSSFLVAICPSAYLQAQQPPVPASGAYTGAVLMEGQTRMSEFNRRTGIHHAAFMEFLNFPAVLDHNSTDFKRLSKFIAECKSAGAMAALTVDTPTGLASYSSQQVAEFADLVNSFGLPVFLRWNREMNGGWYAWGQQPILYIQKFREFSAVMHARAKNVAMVWAPNEGLGYPWAVGNLNSSDLSALDTSKDGLLSTADNPYLPYYPGDEYVDWIGTSLYHWGNRAEIGFNEVPTEKKWEERIGPLATFSGTHAKPLMVAETAAFYDPRNVKLGGAEEADIKRTWIRQVYNLDNPLGATLPDKFPAIKAIFWLNQTKPESSVNGDVDWRLDANPETAAVYRYLVDRPYFIQALFEKDTLTIESAPWEATTGATQAIKIRYSTTQADRELVVNLLDSNTYQWFVGTQKSLPKGVETVDIMITPDREMPTNSEYIWSVVLRPIGSDWTQALDQEEFPVFLIEGNPLVSITAGKRNSFVLSRKGGIKNPLLVGLAFSGTARNGIDYVKVRSAVKIPAQKKSVTIRLQRLRSSRPSKTAVVTVTGKSTYDRDSRSRVRIKVG